MDFMNLLESLFRWLHVLAGVIWIGLLYFFNFVNSAFAPTLDAESKKKVVPQLMPRALFWFRWGAAFTWVTGLLLLLLVYYHAGILFGEGQGWGLAAYVCLAITFLGVIAYDVGFKSIPDPKVQFGVGWVLASLAVILFEKWGGFSYRGASIHLGALFGTTMAFNVWMRIWPAQQKIITAVKNGQPPDAALVALAGARSKHNTYMSVPLLFLMVSQHGTWASGQVWAIPLVILAGWGTVYSLYQKVKTVPGF